MNKTTYLALDIGQVLCHVDEFPFVSGVSETLNVSTGDVERVMRRMWELHDLGHANIRDELAEKLHVKSPILLDKLSVLWDTVVFPNNIVIDFINDMRIKYNIKVALLSNIGIEHAALMKTVLSRGGLYEDSIKHFSCSVGARKPSYLYYQSFLSMHPEFKGCMYIDDRPINIEVGKIFDFKSYCFSLANHYPFQTSVQSLEEDLDMIEVSFLETNKLL
jgi:hypothetical protein